MVSPIPQYKFVQAMYFDEYDSRKVTNIVLHSMESQEKPGTALGVANWFASDKSPISSAHYCVDALEVIQCVLEKDVAYHARGFNITSIGIEHAGRAGQTAEEWMDEYGIGIFRKSVALCAEICKRHSIPAVYVGVDDLRIRKPGITMHSDVSKAFKKSSHWDPGPAFPIKWYVDRVAGLLAA